MKFCNVFIWVHIKLKLLKICEYCTVHFVLYTLGALDDICRFFYSMWYLLACKLACQNKQPRCHTWLFSPLVFTSKNNTFYIHFLDIELKTLGFGTHQPCDTCIPLHDMCSFFRNNTTKSIDYLIDKCLLPGPGFFFRNKTTKVIDCLIDQCLLPGPGFFSWAWMFEQWIFLCRGRWWGPGGCRKILHTYRVSAGLCP